MRVHHNRTLEIFRKDNPVKRLELALIGGVGLYVIIGAIGAIALGHPAAGWTRIHFDLVALLTLIALCGLTPFTYPFEKRFPETMQLIIPSFIQKFGLLKLIEPIPKELETHRLGLAAEVRVAESIVRTFKKQKVKVYSRLDETCLNTWIEGGRAKPKDVDVVAIFPDGVRFAISVKARTTARAVYIDENNQIRLSRKGSTKKMTNPDPATQLIEQEKWLRQHRREILFTPGNSIIAPSVRVLLFASPTIVGQSDFHEYVTLGGKQYLKVTRDKDFVYLLQEDQLCDFIDALLKRK